MIRKLIPAYEKTLGNIGTAMSTSFGDTATWGVAGLREETLVYFLAETMRSLGVEPTYEPCFDDRSRADLSWGDRPSRHMLEAKWWWWSVSLKVVLDDIANKTAFAGHDGNRYALVFSVDDVSCKEGRKTWATPVGARRWMQDVLDEDQLLRSQWSFVGCAATKSPYFGTSWNDGKTAKRRDGVFVAAFYHLK